MYKTRFNQYIENGYRHNIALIRTTKKIEMSNTVQPINLPGKVPDTGTSVVFTGFGRIFVS